MLWTSHPEWKGRKTDREATRSKGWERRKETEIINICVARHLWEGYKWARQRSTVWRTTISSKSVGPSRSRARAPCLPTFSVISPLPPSALPLSFRFCSWWINCISTVAPRFYRTESGKVVDNRFAQHMYHSASGKPTNANGTLITSPRLPFPPSPLASPSPAVFLTFPFISTEYNSGLSPSNNGSTTPTINLTSSGSSNGIFPPSLLPPPPSPSFPLLSPLIFPQ